MVADGTPCLGPVTHAGCGALCPTYHRGCYGCYGPKDTPQHCLPNRLVSRRMGLSEADIVQVLRTFNAYAEPFRQESWPMNRIINVTNLARVEGEGGLELTITDGQVAAANFSIFESPRFFEAFLRGRRGSRSPGHYRPYLRHLSGGLPDERRPRSGGCFGPHRGRTAPGITPPALLR